MLSPPNNQQGKLHPIATTVMVVVWLGLLGLLVLNRQNLDDWWKLRHYHAPAAVAQLATQDTMTPYARKILYVNAPAIDSKAAFVKPCPNNGGEQTIVLGCYHSNQAGIFLLSVSDPRLNGVEQVTIAHEMLHAAYDRLSSSERNKVDAMLLDYFNHDLTDPRIKATMAAYQKTEPHDVVNEMHSVFGTEIANLPAPLEQYYTRYFTNRQQIAAYAAQYQDVFTSQNATLKQENNQLNALLSQFNSTDADLKNKEVQINTMKAQLLSLRNSDVNAYNAGIPAYNNLIVAYNQEIGSLNSLANQFNALRDQYNSLALEENQLAGELNANNATLSH